MPVRTACASPRCPAFAVPGGRGRCAVHRETTSQRGYGAQHRRERTAALPGARCERCGCTLNLQRDHVVPVSMGGSQAPSNKRWLCRCPGHACHDAVGMRRDRPNAYESKAQHVVVQATSTTTGGGGGSRRAQKRPVGDPRAVFHTYNRARTAYGSKAGTPARIRIVGAS
jgi:hypothetical protein